MYDILVISDLHWGVLDEEEMCDQYEFIFYFIQNYLVDLIVIAGDYFDFKLYLNSKRTIKALEWFDRLFHLAKARGVKAIRMFRGTISHDADQMDVFRKYEKEDDNFFRIFEECTSEETLPNLQCVYCPDEIMQTGKYVMRYMDELFANNQLGFFHGSFDVVMNQAISLEDMIVETDGMDVITSITFPFDLFRKLVDYAWIGGHWHDGKGYSNVYYTGSATRWKHNEDEPKGIGFIRVNLEEGTYFYRKILNPIAPKYITYEVHPDHISESIDVAADRIIADIAAHILACETNDEKYQIRIMIYEFEKTLDSENIVRILKDHYASNSNVVIRVKSNAKRKKKRIIEEKKEVDLSFIRNKDISISEQIYEFIKRTTSEEVPLEYIEKMVAKFTK